MQTKVRVKVVHTDEWRDGVLTDEDSACSGGMPGVYITAPTKDGRGVPHLLQPAMCVEVQVLGDCPIALLDSAIASGYFVVTVSNFGSQPAIA